MRKTMAIAFVLSMNSLVGYGQMENIQLNEYTTANKLYAGFYSKLLVPVDSLRTSANASVRLGALITQRFTNVFLLEAQAVVQFNSDKTINALPAFEFITKFSDKLQLRAGVLVTPTTTVRPNPVTWQQQSETYAQSRIIGSKPGVMLRYAPTKDLFLAYAFHNHAGEWANHLRIDYKKLRAAGYMRLDGQYFAAMKYINERFDLCANYSSEQNEAASSLFVNVTKRYSLYCDGNYRVNLEKNEVLRFGARSYFDSADKHLRGFFAVEYDARMRMIGGQVMLSVF
jgi:hypothetical protein